jgi:protein-arginine kinase activator protein McsA
MLCQACNKREATVHLTQTFYAAAEGHEPGTKKQHFCQDCADAYFASTPGMNPSRGLISLSDSYRSRLYDLLETEHPEAFDNHDIEACRKSSEVMRKFLAEHFKQDNIELAGDAFEMLCNDFFGSHHFYTRLDEFNRKKR